MQVLSSGISRTLFSVFHLSRVRVSLPCMQHDYEEGLGDPGLFVVEKHASLKLLIAISQFMR